ncbi:MAG: tRNA (N(6)-L-threonylcarbamoyladenosine(37)-C(2))-methylthiotransferase MtaB [Eubacteriales bacterium]|nr:tRNA (N(6)-L-threonylcarbamoyladenosine(37)-C(2))-methylthiotransferase MtaB [Eubacteriales bacterium]
MRYIIITLGCKVNQYDSQAMEQLLRADGHVPAEPGTTADAVIVNTCAVTAEGARKARQAIRRVRAENPQAVLAVCGCFSQTAPEEVRELGADLVYGSGDRAGLVAELVHTVEQGGIPAFRELPGDARGTRNFEKLPAGASEGRTRAYLKIQDGCDNYCAYCIIPYARGHVRSLPVADCAALVAQLASQGYRELVITGIEIASYGRDLPGHPTLLDAVEAMALAAPEVRLHLGSLEPRVVTQDFCERLSKLSVCSHFHLSLQSGCDETLQRMKRRYDTARFMESVKLLRKYFPGCGLTADLIVGFPGETEEEFEKTLSFVEECAFSSMHIFPYSRREGTRAASLPDQLTRAVKTARAARAQRLAAEMERQYLDSCIGRVLSVLFETESDGMCVGHGENYCEVAAAGKGFRGLVRNVEINGTQGEMLVGVCI